MEHCWISAHLFHTGDLNRLLNELAGPLIQRIGAPAFFIRYWEGGPHIRLRIYVNEADDPAVRRLLEEESSAFFSRHPSDHNGLQYILYEPEISRYGNAQSIHWAERQFAASTAYVLHHIAQESAWNISAALLHAIRLNVGLLYALEVESAVVLGICGQFVRAWLPRLYDPTGDPAGQEAYYTRLIQERFAMYAPTLTSAVSRLWQEITAGGAEEQLQRFIARSREVFRRYRELGIDGEQLQRITGSFLHMGHNRLGLSNLDEAYIMFFTLKSLEHIYEHVDR